jgi:hypothetical protein
MIMAVQVNHAGISALVALLLLGGPAASAGPADAADRQRAAALAAEAEQHATSGEMREALFKFKRAARLDPTSSAYLCNIGLAYYSLSDMPRAHLALSRCHTMAGSWPAGVEDVFNFIVADLAKRDYAPVTLRGEPRDAQISLKAFEDEGDLHAPLKVYLPAGSYAYQASAPGYASKYGEIQVHDRKPVEDTFRLEPALVSEDAQPAGIAVGGGELDSTVTARPARSRRRTWGWVSIGGGAALGVAAGGFYLAARKTHGEFTDGDSGERRTELEDRMNFRQYTAAGLAVGGALAVGAGVYLLMSDDGGEERPMLTVAPSDGGGLLTLSWER